MQGLIALYGGHKKYAERLNENFVKSEPYGFPFKDTKSGNWTDYGNQPGTGMAHLSIMLGHHG